MIEIRDRGDSVEADNGKEKFTYSSWEELMEKIGDVKLYADQNLFIREGNKLMRVRLR